MNLSAIKISVRQRRPWESVDLGCLLVRRWWWPLFLGWTLPALVLFLLLSAALRNHMEWTLSVVWWFKPLWDRVPLHLASRYLFAEEIGGRQFWNDFRRATGNQLFASLTWRRFSPSRSFVMPVNHLEQLRGEPRRRRLALLHLHSGSAATWLTLVCVHIEGALFIGAGAVLILLLPAEVEVDVFDWLISTEWSKQFTMQSLSLLAMAIVAPFYTVAGFMLYIDRRIALEGWDIELRFRHFAATRQRGMASVVTAIALVLTVALGLSHSPPLSADEMMQERVAEAEPVDAAREEVAAVVNQVLAGKDFHRERIERGWRRKSAEERKKNDTIPEWFIHLIEWLEAWFGDGEPDDDRSFNVNIAGIIKGLLVAALITALGYLLWRNRDVLRHRIAAPRKTAPPDIPATIAGLAVTPESLPRAITHEAMALWREGRQRDSMGLLYRACLTLLIHQYGLGLRASYTEGDCLLSLRNAAVQRELTVYVEQLTLNWQRIAYGHRHLPEATIETLCEQWPRWFQHG